MPDLLHGTGVALITPFTREEQIDYPALKRIVDHVTNNGADYLVVMGTTGESATIDLDDKRRILAYVKENNKGKLPMVYGHGGNNTRQMIEELDLLDLGGITAILSVSPYYNKPSQEGIYQHYSSLADASPVPIILYNVPARTGSNVLAQTTIRLSAHKNIAGIKEASGSMDQALMIRQYSRKGFLLISGDDMQTLPFYAIGGSGVISVLANAIPQVFRTIRDSFEAGDLPAAQAAAASLSDLNPLMYEEANPVGLKALLSQMGLCEDKVRLPLAEASNDLKTRISAAYQRFK